MIDWQNLVVAPCVSKLGQPYTIAFGGQTVTPNGVFDEAYAETDVSDGMPVTTVEPCLGINVGDLNLAGQPVSALQGTRLTILASPYPGGSPAVDTDYIIREARADGHGWARLMLNLAPTVADDQGAGQDA